MKNRLALLAALISAPALACCFSSNEPFDYPRVPVAPYDAAALHGVVLPDQALRHLALAYRSASGVPISELELAALVRDWGNVYGSLSTADDRLEARAAWTRAASALLKSEPAVIEPGATSQADYTEWEKVNAGAWRRALLRLADRKKRYARAPELIDAFAWHQSKALGLQYPPRTAPTPPAALAGAWADDLRLFAAQEHFYAGDYAAATTAFDALGGTSEGKWADLSAARAQLRWFSVGDGGDAKRDEAERRLLALKTNDEALSGAARALVLRIHRLKRDFCADLPRALEKRQGDALPHLLTAVENAVDGYTDANWELVQPSCKQVPELRAWLTTFRALQVVGWRRDAPKPEAVAAAKRALEAWKKTPTKAWLLAAVTGADGSEAELPALLDAAKAVPAGDVLGPTFALHRARLLRRAGQRDAARAVLAELPLEKWPVGTRNFFLLERFLLSESAVEAAQHAWPLPSPVVEAEVSWSGHSAQVERGLPVEVLSQALDATGLLALAQGAEAPEALRRTAAWAAFTRRAVLGGDVVEAAKVLQALEPKAALKPVLGAKDAVTAQGEALLFVLRHSGASVNVLASNDVGIKDLNGKQYERYGCGHIRNGWDPVAPFDGGVPWATKLGAAEQQVRVEGSGRTYPKATVAFVTAHPESPVAAELLALAVSASKYAQGLEETKAAFTLLHAKWPKSKWAEQTPIYW